MTPRAFSKSPNDVPQAAIGHMPFTGHRTVDAIWKVQAAARRRYDIEERKAKQYGFDPASLKEAKG